MTGRSRQTPTLSPSSIAIHDAGHMKGFGIHLLNANNSGLAT
jgi:hypothetical protein